MLHTARTTVGVAAIASLAAACSDSTSPATSPTVTQPAAPSAMVTPCPPRTCARIVYDFAPGGKVGPTFIYSMNPDGSNKKQLAKGARPSWSVDHLKIAYVSYANGYDIFTMNGDGSGVTQLTSSPAHDMDPSWSPDGKFISFTSNRAGKTLDIWIMQSNGANPVQLTTSDDADEANPAWSPDGTRIAFSSVSNVTGAWEVHIMDLATKVVTVPPVPVKKAYYPAWSPDGQSLAFASDKSVESCGIWILDMTSTATIAPFKGAGYGRCTHPSFSPDGKRLAFTNYYNDGSMIMSANIDGTNGYWGLTSGPPTVSSIPSWAFR